MTIGWDFDSDEFFERDHGQAARTMPADSGSAAEGRPGRAGGVPSTARSLRKAIRQEWVPCYPVAKADAVDAEQDPLRPRRRVAPPPRS